MKKNQAGTGSAVSFWKPIVLSCLTLGGGKPGASFPPQLQIHTAPSGVYQLTVTNGFENESYELFRSFQIERNTWSLFAAGSPGQTNFFVAPGDGPQMFFQARPQADWDHDGIPDGRDARPYDPAIGELHIVINSPMNGEFIQ